MILATRKPEIIMEQATTVPNTLSSVYSIVNGRLWDTGFTKCPQLYLQRKQRKLQETHLFSFFYHLGEITEEELLGRLQQIKDRPEQQNSGESRNEENRGMSFHLPIV